MDRIIHLFVFYAIANGSVLMLWSIVSLLLAPSKNPLGKIELLAISRPKAQKFIICIQQCLFLALNIAIYVTLMNY